MKYSIIFTTVIALALTSQFVSAEDITDSYSTGDTLTAEKMNNIKSAVNSKQNRVIEACDPGSSIREIKPDGAVTCEPGGGTGDITEVIAAGGLTGGGTSGSVEIRIGTGSVTGTNIQNSTLTKIDIADEPGIDYDDTDLRNIIGVVDEIQLTIPSAGYVMCIAHIEADWNSSISPNHYFASGWTKTQTPTDINDVIMHNPYTVIDKFSPLMVLKTFEESSAGTKTYYLVASTNNADVKGYSKHRACTYYPTRY